MAAALLAAGADINAASMQPFTHPWQCWYGEHPAGTTFLHMHAECCSRHNGVPACIQLALRAGACVSAVDGDGKTPLDIVAEAAEAAAAYPPTWSSPGPPGTLQALITAQQQQ